MIVRFRWWLADRLRPNVWPSTAAQHRVLVEQVKDLTADRRQLLDSMRHAIGELERGQAGWAVASQLESCADVVAARFPGAHHPREAGGDGVVPDENRPGYVGESPIPTQTPDGGS